MSERIRTVMTTGAEAKLGGDWLASLGVTFGKNDSSFETDGALCSSCATLALLFSTCA